MSFFLRKSVGWSTSISINRLNQGCVGQRGATTTALASSNRIFVMQDPKVGVLMASWRSSTKKQYQSFIKRWIQYCNKMKISFLQPDLDDALQFLTDLFETGLSYSSFMHIISYLEDMI
jgi:hypothetical protein